MLEPSWSNLKAWEGLPIWTPNPDEALPNLGSGVTSISAKVPAFHFAGQCSLAHAVLWFGTWCNSTGFFPLFKQLGAKWRLFWSQMKAIFPYSIAQPKWTCWWWRVFLQPWPLPAGAAHWQTWQTQAQTWRAACCTHNVWCTVFDCSVFSAQL